MHGLRFPVDHEPEVLPGRSIPGFLFWIADHSELPLTASTSKLMPSELLVVVWARRQASTKDPEYQHRARHQEGGLSSCSFLALPVCCSIEWGFHPKRYQTSKPCKTSTGFRSGPITLARLAAMHDLRCIRRCRQHPRLGLGARLGEPVLRIDARIASNRSFMPGLNSGCVRMNRSLFFTPLSTARPLPADPSSALPCPPPSRCCRC